MSAPYVIIVGCGRSGTKYISKLFTKAGLDFGHEKVKSQGTANWYFTLRNKTINPPFGDTWSKVEELHKKPLYFHQVRNPLKVIGSACALTEKSWRWVCDHTEIDYNESPLSRSMKYWHLWNLKAESIAQKTYKIESIFDIFEDFEEAFGIVGLKKKLMVSSSALSRSINTRKGRKRYRIFTWDDLFAQNKKLTLKIIEQANRYGYIFKNLGARHV